MPELIDRQEVLEIAMSYCPDDDGCCSKSGYDIREMLDEIEALPTIEPEVRHGQWRYDLPNAIFVCSECKMMYRDNPNFCPRCGAKMDGEEAKENATD